MKLVLFDIDGTLLLSDGAGLTAMEEAGRSLFGEAFAIRGIDCAGRLDPLIFREMALANGVDEPDQHHDAFREQYHELLEARLGTTHRSRALPGVPELLEALAAADDLTLGLVTGNYPETGWLKVRSAGLAETPFEITAWGCDGATRRDLPRVAMEQFQERFDRPLEGDQVIVIGDTPHDIDCAKANGCRVIGVATGPSFERADLAEADLVVDDLSDTCQLLEWIVD